MEIWASERMPLEGAKNVRELGGYPVAIGGKTREREYLRGDTLANLTESDCVRLYEYGVRLVLDLRCRSEWREKGSALLGFRDVVYVSAPLMDDVIEAPSIDDFPESLGIQYIRLLERYKEKIRTIFHCFSGHINKCILFHCTAGKDRTAVVAMLLLMLAGTPEDFIVADYVKTGEYMRGAMDRRMAELAAMGIHYPEHVFRNHPDNIRTVMRHIQEKYGGSAGYLLDCGMQEGSLAQLAETFIRCE